MAVDRATPGHGRPDRSRSPSVGSGSCGRTTRRPDARSRSRFERTVNRVLLIQPRTLEALQATIPAEQPFFGGLTWVRRIGPAVGRPDIPNLGYWIYPRLFPGQEPPGYAAPGIIGEAWANFGAAGLCCSPCSG